MPRSTFLNAAAALASAAYLTACGSPPKDLHLSLQHASTQGHTKTITSINKGISGRLINTPCAACCNNANPSLKKY